MARRLPGAATLLLVATTLLFVVVVSLAGPAGATVLPAGPRTGLAVDVPPATAAQRPTESAGSALVGQAALSYDDAPVVARGDGSGAFSGSFSERVATRSTSVADDLAGAACSFSGATPVVMADGSRKPIEDVEIGDKVLATDPETGETVAREVTHLWVHEDTVVDLIIDGDVITTTEDHPFWNETDAEWQRADQLDQGDLVRSVDGDLLEVEGLDRSSARAATAYNLTVDDIHTYYVAAGDDTVLVHNTCGPYEVGRFNDLQSRSVVGDNLDIHHVPQRHPAGQTISGYDPQTAPSIALPRGEHTAIPNWRGPATLSTRDQLARDIWNLRTHTNAPNSALRELIDLNRQLYPGAFAK